MTCSLFVFGSYLLNRKHMFSYSCGQNSRLCCRKLSCESPSVDTVLAHRECRPNKGTAFVGASWAEKTWPHGDFANKKENESNLGRNWYLSFFLTAEKNWP